MSLLKRLTANSQAAGRKAAAEPKPTFAERREEFSQQFRDLDRNDPSSWPAAPKYLILFAIVAGICTLLWFLVVSAMAQELEQEQTREVQLRQDYKVKLAKAQSFEILKQQKAEVQEQVAQLEKQLPSKAEMDALLDNINESARAANLESETFKPAAWLVSEYYAELPINIKYKGKLHDIGMFTGNIAQLSRIVALNNLQITTNKDGVQVLEAIARTFRYLEEQEIEARRKAKAEKPKAP